MVKKFLTTTQAARILGISRMHMLRKIKSGQIKSSKAGRNYLVAQEDLSPAYKSSSISDLKEVDRGVEKVVKEYGEVIKKLGKE